MKSYSTFIFESYSYDPAQHIIELSYGLDNEISFTEVLHLPKEDPVIDSSSPTLHRVLKALHLVGGISYFKTCLPKNIEVRTHTLTETEANFWNTVYEKGLGEFFFKNSIDFRGLIRFPFDPNATFPSLDEEENHDERVLVPMGGGKDSIVSLELLKEAGLPCTLLRIGKNSTIDAIAAAADATLINIDRRIDPLLFRLNAEGALNGHVPITAYVSILSSVIAILYGYSAVVMSNERSASSGNTLFHGQEINHQWSKSLEFERMLQEYLSIFVRPTFNYFSLLRPLSELSIAEIFSRYPRYFPLVTSCNVNWKIKGSPSRALWCGSCPKCAFVFALLAAYLPQKTLVSIFKKNLFEDPALLPLYRQLLGIEGMKPFECVGTKEEVIAAFMLAQKQGEMQKTEAMRMFATHLPSLPNPEGALKDTLSASKEHAIPARFLSLLSL